MAYLDGQNEYSDAQAVTASAASTNLIDHKAAFTDVGSGENVFLLVTCVTAMTDAASNSTVAVTIETDDNTSFSSAATAQTAGTFAAESAVGAALKVKIDPGALVERYSRVYYTVAGGDLTTGSFDAQLVLDVDTPTKNAPNGYTITD